MQKEIAVDAERDQTRAGTFRRWQFSRNIY